MSCRRLVLLTGTTLTLGLPLGAQLPQTPHASPSADLPIDTAVRIGALPNGLRYYIRHNATPSGRAEFRLAVDAGSILEDNDQRGMAHFVEHMAFNGTTHFPHGQLVNSLAALGLGLGADVNAATGYDETVYQLSVPTRPVALDTTLAVLLDWAQGLTFDPQEVEEERGVVFSERRLALGAGEGRTQDFHRRTLYGDRYGERSPIGTGESILHGSRAALMRFYHDWYRPDLMTVIAVGDFDPRAMEARIVAMFGGIPTLPSPRRRPPVAVMTYDSAVVSISAETYITQFAADMYIPESTTGSVLDATAVLTAAAHRRAVVEAFLKEVLNARLHTLALSRETPIQSARVGSSIVGRAVPEFGMEVTPKEPSTLELGIIAVRAELTRLARDEVTPRELDETRQRLLAMQTAAVANAAQTSSSDLAEEYVNAALARRPIPDPKAEATLALQLARVVTAAEVQALATTLNATQGPIILINAPKDDPYGVPNTEVVLDAFQRGAKRALPPYRDSAEASTLAITHPTPGTIVRQRVVPTIGVTEWTLSNGARVLLKPTKATRDAIAITAVSAGGTSLASDHAYPSAAVASDFVTMSGLGPYNAEMLMRRIAGLAEWNVQINPWDEMIHTEGSFQNASTVFDLLTLAFTAPRLERDSVASWKHDLHMRTPDALHFAVQRASAQRHPRARPILGPIADSIDGTTALAFYRARFADAGHFTFVIVGDFVPDSLRPLVERTIGSLPGHPTATPERARDLGIRAPDRVVRGVVVGEDSSSNTALVFDTAMVTISTSATVLRAVGEVLNMRVRQRLREEMNGTYSPSVSVLPMTLPYQHATALIQFESSPDRTAELQRALFAVIDTFATRGVDPAELQTVQRTLRERRAHDAQGDGYWLDGLIQAARDGESLDEYAAQEQQLATLTPAMVNAAARQLFNLHRYVLVTSLPLRLAPVQRDELSTTQW